MNRPIIQQKKHFFPSWLALSVPLFYIKREGERETGLATTKALPVHWIIRLSIPFFKFTTFKTGQLWNNYLQSFKNRRDITVSFFATGWLMGVEFEGSAKKYPKGVSQVKCERKRHEVFELKKTVSAYLPTVVLLFCSHDHKNKTDLKGEESWAPNSGDG